MNLHGFTEEEAERELLKARQRDNHMREVRAMYPRYEKKLKEVLENDRIQYSVDNLGMLIEAKSYDIDGGWAGEELNERIAWMLTDDEYENEPDEYAGWYEEESERVYRAQAEAAATELFRERSMA